jgi:hypothetical protein
MMAGFAVALVKRAVIICVRLIDAAIGFVPPGGCDNQLVRA